MPARLVTALLAALVALLPSACGGSEPQPAPAEKPATTSEPRDYGYG